MSARSARAQYKTKRRLKKHKLTSSSITEQTVRMWDKGIPPADKHPSSLAGEPLNSVMSCQARLTHAPTQHQPPDTQLKHDHNRYITSCCRCRRSTRSINGGITAVVAHENAAPVNLNTPPAVAIHRKYRYDIHVKVTIMMSATNNNAKTNMNNIYKTMYSLQDLRSTQAPRDELSLGLHPQWKGDGPQYENDNREKDHTGPLEGSAWTSWAKGGAMDAPELRVRGPELTIGGGPSHGDKVPSSGDLGQFGQIRKGGDISQIHTHTWFDDEHSAAMDGTASPGGGTLEPVMGRGNVDPFCTKPDMTNATMDRQPSPDWGSCELGNSRVDELPRIMEHMTNNIVR